MVVALHRRTSAFARTYGRLEGSLELARCAYNFLRPHRALKFGRVTRTPAMQAGLATRPLTFRDVFLARLTEGERMIEERQRVAERRRRRYDRAMPRKRRRHRGSRG
jgi:hypothetical protein